MININFYSNTNLKRVILIFIEQYQFLQQYKEKSISGIQQVIQQKLMSENPSQQQQSHNSLQLKPSYKSGRREVFCIQSTQTNIDSSYEKHQQSINPKYITFIIIGKIVVILIYFLLNNLQLLNFMFVVITSTVDFWINKNIYGKQLAGLRWWVQIDQYTQDDTWIFQSADPNVTINTINHGAFWITNSLAAIFWLFNFFFALVLTNYLFWVSLCLFCLSLNLINLTCFYKCRGTHQKKLIDIIERVGFKSATNLLGQSQEMAETPNNLGKENNYSIQ